MAEQEALVEAPTFDPLSHGLWRRFVDLGVIRDAYWRRTVAEGAFVGTCRNCGGHLRPAVPDVIGPERTDYEAECIVCGRTVLAPGGRVYPRSSRKSERNSGGKER